MGRRGQECRCCGECKGCTTTPTLMRANIAYPTGLGVTLLGDVENAPPAWQDVSTDCSIEQARRFVQRVRITEPGEGYTVAPMLAITGGGGTPSLDAWIEITSPVVGVVVDNPGSGYTKAPAVTFSGGGKIQAAKAEAVIEGKIVSLTLTDPGEGYAGPPQITFSGGKGAAAEAQMDGYLLAIEVTSPGEGYTSPPSVTLSGGGGSGASAIAFFSSAQGVVTGFFVTNKGEGYTSLPEVVLSGGGGDGATAKATIAYQVQSLSLIDGGDGYPESPVVKFIGPASRSASATATIDGKVVAVNVSSPGLYRHRRNAAGTVLIDWPTVSIAGSATATLEFSGKVTAINPGNVEINTIRYNTFGPGTIALSDNKNYESIPSVEITGGGGEGAAAVAELNWLPEHDRTADFLSCRSLLTSAACYSTDTTPAPVQGGSDCTNAGERFTWIAQAFLNFDDLSIGTVFLETLIAGVGGPTAGGPLPLRSWFWQGEGVVVRVSRGWGAGFVDVGFDNTLLPVGASEIEIDWFVARRFSRVPPDVTYAISAPDQPEAAENVRVIPEWTQYVDAKGDSFWYLESLSVDFAGENLFVPPDAAVRLVAVGNATHEFRVFEYTFSRQVPEAVIGVVGGFTAQPEATVMLSEIGSPAGTFYRISSVSIEKGGSTDAEDGPVSVPVLLTSGHWTGSPITLSGTIAGGQLSAVTVPAPSQQIIAPARLIDVEPQEDESFNNVSRITAGRSPFQVTYEHTAPEVVARAIGVEGGEDSVFACTMAQKIDLNGDPFWEIASAIATTPGNPGNPVLVFEPTAPGIMAVPPVAYPVFEREQPTVFAQVAFGPGVGAAFSVNLAQRAGEFGDEYWEVASVDVVNGGSGYQDGAIFFSGELTVEKSPAASYQTQDGQIVSVTVIEPGWFYKSTGGLRRLGFWNRGRFFVREIRVSEDPLPEVSCKGPVNEEEGWHRNKLLLQIDSGFQPPRPTIDARVGVGEQYDSVRAGLEPQFAAPFGSIRYSRVRRCPLPEIEVELE